MSGLKTLEHVAVTVSITHPRRGSLELKLFCPSGMMSLIGAPAAWTQIPTASMIGPSPLCGAGGKSEGDLQTHGQGCRR